MEVPFNIGKCCACGRLGRSVKHLFRLPLKAKLPGKGWGCDLCHLADDGALVALCDDCLDRGTEPTHACRGFPATDGRILISDLTRPHLCDPKNHENGLLPVPQDPMRRAAEWQMARLLQDIGARCGVGNSPAGPGEIGDLSPVPPAGEAAGDVGGDPFWRGPFFRGADQA